MSLNNTILSVTRRTVTGFTVGEIYDRVVSRLLTKSGTADMPPYNSVRARVYELAAAGRLSSKGVRKDASSGRTATVFVRS